MSQLADRLAFFQESVIREMTRKAIENDAINLSQGMPDYTPHNQLIEGILDSIKEEEHQYTVTYGREDLREKISEKYVSFNKILYNFEDEITITCGASEAIASSILAVLNPGDEILILSPWYENYVPITYLAGGKPVFVDLKEENFALEEEGVKEAINSKTKAIIINTPHNPSGKVFSKNELQVLSDICIDNNIITITDEIYEHIIYDGLKHVSPASLEDMFERTITISGFSKTYSITGWRIGYALAEKEIMEGVRKVHDYLTICAPSILQYAALNTFELQQDYFNNLKNRYQDNRDEIVTGLQKLGFRIVEPKGAYYFLADISDFGKSDVEFADFLVRDQGVATVPGSSFYEKTTEESKGSKYVRFSFSHKLETLQEAILRIEKRIK
jgi:aminotransferase